MKLLHVLLTILLSLFVAQAQEITSPDGKLEWSIHKKHNLIDGFLLSYDDKPLLKGGFGLQTQQFGDLLAQQEVEATETKSVSSEYVQPGGKSEKIQDRFNELLISLKNPTKEDLELSIKIRVRVYDDGAAFRYEVDANNPQSFKLTLLKENSWFLPDVSFQKAWPLYLPNYFTSHEAPYEQSDYSIIKTKTLIAAPLLLEKRDGEALVITEAALRNYPGMYLEAVAVPVAVEKEICLMSHLSESEHKPGIKAEYSGSFKTPWRVMMRGSSAGKLIESNLVLNLNEPSVIEDTSWIRFGKTTWNWWNGFYQEPVDFKIGANYKTLQHYIDFCAENDIAFHAIDCADSNWTWYKQSRAGFAPGPDADIITPRPELEFFRALEYAKSKNVGIRLWVHWKPFSQRLEEAMATYASWGVEGLMVDFLDRDHQEMVTWTEEVLKVAASHKMRIQYHGISKPTGIRRTYPNLINHEGVLNQEYSKWSKLCTTEHNVTVPYTRMLAGPMDYHLGGFRSATPEAFTAQNAKPMVMGTRCHQLAMYVIYDNAVPMVCDAPTAFQNQPGFDLLKQVPTTWDETRFLQGQVGEYIVMARRKGEDWYIAAMTNGVARKLTVELAMFIDCKSLARVWTDVGSENPNDLQILSMEVVDTSVLDLSLSQNGGQVIWIQPSQ